MSPPVSDSDSDSDHELEGECRVNFPSLTATVPARDLPDSGPSGRPLFDFIKYLETDNIGVPSTISLRHANNHNKDICQNLLGMWCAAGVLWPSCFRKFRQIKSC